MNIVKSIYFLAFVGLAFSGSAQVPGTEWVKGSGSASGSGATGNSIATDLNGNVYTGGTFHGTIDFDPGPGVQELTSNFEQDGFILKLDVNGVFQWVKNIGGEVASITLDGTGDVYTTGWFANNQTIGSFTLNNQGHSDVFITRIDTDGNFEWISSVGAIEYEQGTAITADNSGVYVAGFFEGSNVSFGPVILSSMDDSQDAFVTKLDPDGNFIWAKNMGGDAVDAATAIANRLGNIYITGTFNYPTDSNAEFGPFNLTSKGSQDAFVCSMDENGNFNWAKSMGGTASEAATAIALDGSGNIYTTGTFAETADFDPDATDIVELTSVSTTSDIFISKLDASGNFVWAKSFAGADGDATGSAYSIKTNTTGDVYTAGYFFGIIDVDPDPSAGFYLSSVSGSYIVKLNSDGELQWAGSNDDEEYNEIRSIDLDDSGNIYITGTFSGHDVDLSPDSCEANLTSAGDNDLFVTKTGTAPSLCGAITITLQPVSQTVCVGVLVSFEIDATGASNITYQWQVEEDDGDGGIYWVDITDGGGYSGTATRTLAINTAGNFGEGNYRCIVSGDLASDETSNEATLDIGPDMPIVLGSEIVHCGPGSVTITAFGGVNGQYKWYTQSTGGVPIAGEFNSTYTTPVISSTTTYYVAINNGSCESARNSVQVAISTCQAQPGFVWAQGFGAADMSNGTQDAADILVDGDGNILVSGTFQGTFDFDNGPGTTILTAVQYDAYLMKMTPAGALLWVKTFGGAALDYGGEISIDAAGNIYMMSSFQQTADFDPGTAVVPLTTAPGSPANKADIAISKFDKNGNFIWVQQIGGASDEFGSRLEADAAGNVYVVGSFRQIAGGTSFGGTFTLNANGAGSTDIFFAKLNTTGTFLWAGNIGAPIPTGTNFLSDAGIGIDIDGLGNVYVSGRISGPATVDFDPGPGIVGSNTTIDGAAFLLKLNTAGVYQNHYLIENASGNSLKVDPFNNVYITGAFSGTIDLDPGPGNFPATGDGANYVTKLNSSGNFVWGKVFAPDFAGASVLFYDFAFDAAGDVYSTGYYTGTTDFDPGPLVESKSMNGMSILNTFTLKLTASGDFNWVTTMRRLGAGIVNASPGSLALNTAGEIYLAGSYNRNVDFDPGSCVFGLTNVNGSSIYVMKLSPGLPNVCLVTHPLSVSTCDNTTVTFTTAAASEFPVLYQWQKLNTSTSLYEDIINTGGYSNVTTSILTVNTAGNFGAGTYRAKIYSDRTPAAFSNPATLSLSGVIPPIAFGDSGCFDTSFVLKASGGLEGQYRWYTEATGGTPISGAVNSTYITPKLSVSTTYYVSLNLGGTCESARTPVTISLHACAPIPDLVWAKSFGRGGGSLSMTIDVAGNVYTTGTFSASADFDPGAGTFTLTSGGQSDAFISKLDAAGNFVWARSYGANQGDQGNAIAVDATGNVYVTGTFMQTVDFDPGAGTFPVASLGSYDSYILKLDKDGNFVWVKTFGASGSSQEIGQGITLDAAGNIYSTGYFQGTVDFDPGAGTSFVGTAGGADVYIIKLDPSGNLAWVKTMGGPSTDLASAIHVDDAGNIYTAGFFIGTSDYNPGAGTATLTALGDRDVFVSKLDASGNFVWAKNFGGTGTDTAGGLSTDASGNVMLSGSFQTTVDFDPAAPIVNLTSRGSSDIFILKLNASGDLVWANAMGSTGEDGSADLVIDHSNNIYFSGSFHETMDIDGAVSTFNLSAVGDQEIFTSKIDQNGNFVWAIQLGGSADEYPHGMSIDAAGNLYLTGGFYGSGDYDPGPGVVTLNPATAPGTYVLKLGIPTPVIVITSQPSSTVTCNDVNATFSIAAGGTTNISYQWQKLNTTISLYENISNTGGYSGTTTATLTINPASDFGAGSYRCKVSGDLVADVLSDIVTLTISPTPAAPAATNVAKCLPGSVTVTASGGSSGQYGWYDVATGGTAMSGQTNDTFTTPSLSATTSYYVSIHNGTCESARTQVNVTIGGTACTNQQPIITEIPIATQIEGNVTVSLTPFLSDPDNNLDLSTLRIIAPPASGATASIDASHNLMLDYKGISFSGTEKLTIEVCDLLGSCVQKELVIEVVGDVIVYNGISPNEDQENDFFYIQYIDVIEEAKKNHVSIYNRWGDLLFDVADYNNTNNAFRGLNNNGNEMPSGTYFYKINFTSDLETKSGYLYLKR